MRNLISAAILLASLAALLGVGERAFAALRLTWKFGFEKVEPVYLVPQSFWVFALCFMGLALAAFSASRLWAQAQAQRAPASHVRWLGYAKALQMATAGLLFLMFAGGFFSLS